jgi:uncharacterized protein
MTTVAETWVRLYAELNDFLPAAWRQRPILRQWDVRPSVKDLVEGLGVPHPEVDLLLANGQPVGFDYLVQDGDWISAYPRFRALDVGALSLVRPAPLAEARFVLDGHLGRLAAYLRMLGFDTLYRSDYGDEELAQVSHAEGRILLTRDQQLLMRSIVEHGYWVRATEPAQQLVEVARRYGLAEAIHPFTRCLRCNAELAPVGKQEIAHLLAPATRREHDAFRRCVGCGRIYWPGSHVARMQALIEELREGLEAPPA